LEKPVPAAKEDSEARELAKMMMSKRDKKLYDKIQFGKQRKMNVKENLQRKKSALVGKK
jgi:pescadillo protein